VQRITLFLFGGVSNLEREPSSAATEFFMALVGPLSSLLIGTLFSVLGALWVGVDAFKLGEPTSMFARLGPIPTLLLWLGPINILLGLFNLIPGFPLDGGRILRSILWAATKDLQKATRWAASVGQLIGWLFIVAGISIAFGVSIPLFGAGVVNGLWLAFIGWFLLNAATASRSRLMIEHLLEDLQVSRLMRRDVPQVPDDMPLGTLVYEKLLGTDERSFAVFDGATLVGSVSFEDVRKIPRGKWDETPVREIMTPASQLGSVGPREQAADAYRELIERGLRQLPVIENGRLLGFFRRSDVARWLQLQHS
jgi:Zn-dependent protease